MRRLIRGRGRWRPTLAGLIKTILAVVVLYYFGAETADRGRSGKREPPEHLAGAARVVDGDTLEVEGETLRLQGIDAPEMAQTCEADGRPVHCGKLAAQHLDGIIGARTVDCAVEGRDRYGRGLARCRTGGRDVAEAMTREGWALSDRRHSDGRYDAAEMIARAGRRGIWAMKFEDPAEWRARSRESS
jgi:endonuclease YncB( thermonuclease family)